MADNYLEKKMEEHQRGGVPGYALRRTMSGRKAGFAMLPFDVATALVFFTECDAVVQALTRELRETGCKVALAGPDSKSWISFANSLGCASVAECDYDAAFSKISAKWNEPELRIRYNGEAIEMELGRGTSRIIKADATSDDDFAARAARLCIYLALPDSQGRVFGDFTV